MKSQQFLHLLIPLAILTVVGLKQLSSHQTNLFFVEEASSRPKSSDPPKVILSNHRRRISFIHVGKAGGNTVREALPRLKCFRLLDPHQRSRCYHKTSSSSPLSEATDLEIHMKFGLKSPAQLQENYTSFLFALRNPLTRIVSAYHYLHPNNTASVYAQMKHENKTLFYNQCFPTEEDLLEAVDQVFAVAGRNDTSSLTSCQKLSIVALRGKDPLVKHINAHFYYNHEFYMDLSLEAHPSKEVLVVRTETLWEDLIQLDRSLNGPGWFRSEGRVMNANRPKMKAMMATQEQQNKLCCVLWKEIATYQQILERGVNLLEEDKADAIQQLTEMCGVDARNNSTRMSWRIWQQQSCPNLDRFLI